VHKHFITGYKHCIECGIERIHIPAVADWDGGPAAFFSASAAPSRGPSSAVRSPRSAVGVSRCGTTVCAGVDIAVRLTAWRWRFRKERILEVLFGGSSQFGTLNCWRVGEEVEEGVGDLQVGIEGVQGSLGICM
jgi:hypothetical protein